MQIIHTLRRTVLLLALLEFSAAKTDQAAGLSREEHFHPRPVAEESSHPRQSSAQVSPRLLRRAASSGNNSSASRHSSSTGSFYRELFGEPSVQDAHRSPSHHSSSPPPGSSSKGGATISKDSWSSLMRAASAAEKAAPELFDEVTSRPAGQKRPRPVLSEEEKRQRRIESGYRTKQRAKGLAIPAAPGYAARTGENRGRKMNAQELASVASRPLSAPITRRHREWLKAKMGSASDRPTGASHPLSTSQRPPTTSAHTITETPLERKRRQNRESSKRYRLRAKGVPIPFPPGHKPKDK